MEMKRRFWADEHADGFAVTDLPIGELWDGSFNQPGRAGILVAYTTGGHARELCALPATERLASALKQTERVYPGAGDQCSGGTSVCWDEEAWSRGGWAVYRPGEAVGLPRIAAEPEGRVFFAGDHVSDLPGWMEGAIASGKRAVAAIHRRINRLE
jgi:monoamine oxidase